MSRRTWVAVLLVLSSTFAAGCWFRGPGRDLRREVAQLSDLRLDREFGLRMGRPTLFFVRQGVRIAGMADEIPLRGVRRVEVGVYRVLGARPGARRSNGATPAALGAAARGDDANELCRMRFAEWEPVVRVCDGDEHVLLFARIEDDSIQGLLVVVQDDEEVVLVRARGKLDRLLERVVELAEEEGMPWARHEGPDPEPRVTLCGDAGTADGCADAEQARERVMEVARALTFDHDLLR